MKRNRPTFRAATAFGLLFVFFAIATAPVAARETPPTPPLSFVERIQKTAETLDVFPVDLIARNGEISRFRPGSPLPDVESDAESFERFREFCQLALDATPQDVDALVERLAPGNFPENAPKETALILTVLYVYAFPWEKVAPIESENERAEAAKTQSWFALQFASGAFDLSVRRNFRPQNAESLNRLARIVAQFAAYPQAAFPARPLDENAAPVAEDAGETSRTLGQIARLLVDSWEPSTPFSRLERIQLAAETLEFFPVDLIARDGPLSFFEKNSPYPKISFRKELTPVAFERFYNFCQLALDATPQDVDAQIEYLPQASPTETALILTVFYVYAFPWEDQRLVASPSEHAAAIRTRSWLALQYPFGVFDGATREKFHPQNVDSERLLRIIAQYVENESSVFLRATPFEFEEIDAPPDDEDGREIRALVESLFPKRLDSLDLLLARKDVATEIRRRYPDAASTKIARLLYENLGTDMFPSASGLVPAAGNASVKTKTLGQIARQLLESWERAAALSYVERIRRTAERTELFPVDLIARDGEISFFEKGSDRAKIAVREELTPGAFERFYDFCQLAFDATPQNIDALIEYLPQASPKEKALILTVLYVAAHPWERYRRVENAENSTRR